MPTTTLPTPERYARKWCIGDNLRWGSDHRIGEWHRAIYIKPWGRRKH